MQLNHDDIQHIRRQRGHTVLLFITDRCPVECDHCSVSSRRDSPSITDYDRFDNLLEGVFSLPKLELLGVSGGEPFVEKRGLQMVAVKTREHHLPLVVYTSGVWAVDEKTPQWIKSVLRACTAVYLSTDLFHEKKLKPGTFVRAARAIAAADCWIIVQTLDLITAQELLFKAFGPMWDEFAELQPIKALANGRGSELFHWSNRLPGHSFGPCDLALAPVVRYDGKVTACCNEEVITGRGPKHLKRECSDATELRQAIAAFQEDPLLKVIRGPGLGTLTFHPRFNELANRHFSNNCELCWTALENVPDRLPPDPLLNAIASMEYAE